MIPATRRRVEQSTAENINHAHRREIDESLRYHTDRPAEIPARLAELDREWDIERALQANAGAVALAGLALTALVDRRFIAVPAMVAGFLMQHAVRGWCPPVLLLRRLGFRTAAEICEERCGLKMLGGDDRAIGAPASAQWPAEAELIHEAVEA